ncbi:MAG: phosphate acetyltransferase [Ferruginibacter sp.]
MSKAIYIASAEPYCGKSVVTLGLMHMLVGKMKKIAYFRPVINQPESEGKDVHIETVLSHFGLSMSYKETYALTFDELLRYRSNGNHAQIIDIIIAHFKKLEETHDFVLVEGTGFDGDGQSFEFNANVEIARNLGIPMILVCKGDAHDAEETVNNIMSNYQVLQDKEVKLLGMVANKIDQADVEPLQKEIAKRLPKEVIYTVIPFQQELNNPTMKEIVEAVEGEVLFGAHLLTNPVDQYMVGAMQLRNCLTRLKDNTLIVTPGDRADIIVAALQANISKNYPRVAGIVLTGGLEPEEPIIRLIEGLEKIVPIIQVESGTFETVNMVGNIHSRIYPENKSKIELAINTFEQHIDSTLILDKISTARAEGITPRMFQYQLVKRARQEKKHIVLPEGNDDRILTAAARLLKQDIVSLTILGKYEEVKTAFDRLNLKVDMSRLQVINPIESPLFDAYVATFMELRKSKNIGLEMATDLMKDVSYFGTMMVYKGDADGMVSGALHTTQHTIRPALQFVKTKPGIETVSSIFFMCLPDRVTVFGDCAVNPNPTSEQLADIAISSAESSLMFGIVPKIAMLSYSSGSSGQGEDVEKVRRATSIIKERRPDLKVEGPIQYDAAVDPEVGRQKMPQSEVAGQASVLIFPDLNTGNNTYKAVQRETGALAIGPMLQGLNKPVNDLSRGCTVDDVFNTVVITAIQAQQK